MAEEGNRRTTKKKTLDEFEKPTSACINCGNLKLDVENLADLMLKLRLKTLQIGLDVNRAQIKCVAAKEFITVVANIVDDIGSMSTTLMEPNNEDSTVQGDK